MEAHRRRVGPAWHRAGARRAAYPHHHRNRRFAWANQPRAGVTRPGLRAHLRHKTQALAAEPAAIHGRHHDAAALGLGDARRVERIALVAVASGIADWVRTP